MKASESDRLSMLPFFLLMAAVFAVYVGYGIVLPVLPFLLERVLGDGARFSVAWHTGMIAGIYMLALFVCAPLWGCVSDRIGRRPVILLGLGGFEVAIALQGKQVLGLDPLQIGLIFMECSLVMVAVQALVFSPLARRADFRFIVTPAFLAMAVGLWLLPAVADMDWVMVLVGLFAAGSGILIPMLACQMSLDASGAQGVQLGGQTAAAMWELIGAPANTSRARHIGIAC